MLEKQVSTVHAKLKAQNTSCLREKKTRSICFTSQLLKIHSIADLLENGLEDMGRGKGKLGRSERMAWTYIHYQT